MKSPVVAATPYRKGLAVRSRLTAALLISTATISGAPAAFAQADLTATEALRKAPEDEIVVTAARSILPVNALPLTVDVIG